MTPEKTEDGWVILRNGRQIAGPFQTNSEAWRWIDRHSGEPISPAEKTSAWIADRIIGGSGR